MPFDLTDAVADDLAAICAIDRAAFFKNPKQRVPTSHENVRLWEKDLHAGPYLAEAGATA